MQNSIKVNVESFFSQFPSYNYKRGEIVIHPNDSPLGAYYLKKGYVKEYSISTHGIETTLHIFAPASYFPMMWVIAGIPNRYYHEALTDVKVYKAPKDKVVTFLKENPDALLDLTKRIFMGLDKLTSRIESVSYSKASEKVVSTILYLARHFGEEKDKKIYIKHKFTHRDIASLAGITRETTSREWEKLEKRGRIRYKDQFIVILNMEKLKNELLN